MADVVHKGVTIPIDGEIFIREMQQKKGDRNMSRMYPGKYPNPYIFSERVSGILWLDCEAYSRFGEIPDVKELFKCYAESKARKLSKTSSKNQ